MSNVWLINECFPRAGREYPTELLTKEHPLPFPKTGLGQELGASPGTRNGGRGRAGRCLSITSLV